MIVLPRRSVTRFFIPLIDVLTLMFCIFLLMPIIKPADPSLGDSPTEAAVGADHPPAEPRRPGAEPAEDLAAVRRERDALRRQLTALRQRLEASFNDRFAIRVLEIGEQGRLFYLDPSRSEDRRIEITQANVADWLARQQREVGDKQLHVLILYPRRASGFPGYPLQEQRRTYDRWFAGVSHGYDIPYPGGR
ncbi:MAG: hypothetical protein NZ700_18055 [Gemmataceae bacterium]|nr:hypothetical protein [Gemmataceae bacterium]MDW8267329.1 hypothetical protein [Gemmataceae bacterium]